MIFRPSMFSAALLLLLPAISFAADPPASGDDSVTLVLPPTRQLAPASTNAPIDIAALVAAARAMPSPDDKCLSNGSQGKGRALGHCKGLSPD